MVMVLTTRELAFQQSWRAFCWSYSQSKWAWEGLVVPERGYKYLHLDASFSGFGFEVVRFLMVGVVDLIVFNLSLPR